MYFFILIKRIFLSQILSIHKCGVSRYIEFILIHYEIPQPSSHYSLFYRKRVADKQALFNELVEIKENAIVKELPLDIDPETKEQLVKVHPQLCEKLKPHQARGMIFILRIPGLQGASLENSFCS